MIEVNDYVRTKDGTIGKVIKVLSNRVFLNSLGYAVLIKDIVKHSKQLIDLVEVGDYVNGHKVINILKNKINNNKLIVLGNMDYEFETEKELIEMNGIKLLGDKEIQTILTKEQYLANCYKVGGEDEC